MNIKRYLVFNCEWKKLINDASNEYGLTHESPVNLKCFRYNNAATFGKSSFVINGQEIINRSTTTYIIEKEGIKEGDLIDDMTVNAVDTYSDTSGKYLFTACGVI